jgi:hypothetical protein
MEAWRWKVSFSLGDGRATTVAGEDWLSLDFEGLLMEGTVRENPMGTREIRH